MRQFLKQMASEPGLDGTPSFARFGSLLILLFTLGALAFTVYKHGGTNGVDFNEPMIFMLTGIGNLYGVNKIVTQIGKKGP